MEVLLVTPEKELFKGEAHSITVPAEKGIMQILPGHAPLLAVLGRGPAIIEGSYGVKEFRISSGFIEVHKNKITLLAQSEEV